MDGYFKFSTNSARHLQQAELKSNLSPTFQHIARYSGAALARLADYTMDSNKYVINTIRQDIVEHNLKIKAIIQVRT